MKINRNVYLYGNPLPWVSNVKHLGNTLQNDNSMKIDVSIKRGAFIGKVNSLLQEFHNIVPDLLMKLVNSFATSLTGSSVWDLTSKECEQLYRSWNVTVRNVFKLNRTTHRNLIETLSDSIHLKTALFSRLVNFYRSLRNSSKFCIRYLARICGNNKNNKMGKVLDFLCDLCSITEPLDITPKMVKEKLFYSELQDDEQWKGPLGKELMNARNQKRSAVEIPGFSYDELNYMLDFICTK